MNNRTTTPRPLSRITAAIIAAITLTLLCHTATAKLDPRSPLPDGYECALVDGSADIYHCWNPALEHNGG